MRDAVAAIEDIYARGRWPILVGGTGLYYRALVARPIPRAGRGRAHCARGSRRSPTRRGVEFLHRMLKRVDPPSAARILPRDRKRMMRALEVFFLTGKPLTDHFAATVSPLASYQTIVGCAVAADGADRTSASRRVLTRSSSRD